MTFSYTTANLDQRQRVHYWRESVSAHLVPAEAAYHDPTNFQGSLSGHSIGNLTICEMKARAHTLARTPDMLRRAPDEDFVAVFVRSGMMSYAQGEHEVHAKTGSIILVDAARQFSHSIDHIDALVLRLPRRHLLTNYPRAESLVFVDLAKKSSISKILHGLVEEAFQLTEEAGVTLASTRLVSALLDMLAVAMEFQDGGQGSSNANRYDVVYQKAARFIEANLEDYDLDLEDVATATNTSPRTLARAFAAHGSTVMKHLWTRRLAASYALLSNGRVDQVTQAAYQCGFNEMSHFTRTFKQTFGVTPSSLLRNCSMR